MLSLSRRALFRRLARGERNEPPGQAIGAEGAIVVSVFLRGGADGLSLVAPYRDRELRRLRPTLALSSPDSMSADETRRALDLDGFFGLHPALFDLLPAYEAGEMAIVHAIGSDDDTRSHFEAQDRMEHGSAEGQPEGSGWLSRLARAAGGSTPLSAVALGTSLPEGLRGAVAASVFESAREHRLGVEGDSGFVHALADLYRTDDAIGAAGRDALGTLARLRGLEHDAPDDARYPDDRFGRYLRELATVIRGGLPVQVASVDLDGWDTHFLQADSLRERARTLAAGLSAFRTHLGIHRSRVTIVVMTEFGRRAYENGSLGTDHGRGSVLFALGAGVRGGRVYGAWPGLSRLEGPGDLRVTTDYRTVLSELVRSRFPRVDASEVFAGNVREPLGVFGA